MLIIGSWNCWALPNTVQVWTVRYVITFWIEYKFSVLEKCELYLAMIQHKNRFMSKSIVEPRHESFRDKISVVKFWI